MEDLTEPPLQLLLKEQGQDPLIQRLPQNVIQIFASKYLPNVHYQLFRKIYYEVTCDMYTMSPLSYSICSCEQKHDCGYVEYFSVSSLDVNEFLISDIPQQRKLTSLSVEAVTVGPLDISVAWYTNTRKVGGHVYMPVSLFRGPRRVANQIPDEILQDSELQEAIKALPANYNFEIHKTVWRVRQVKAQRVALQLPEGLQMFACVIADIIESNLKASYIRDSYTSPLQLSHILSNWPCCHVHPYCPPKAYDQRLPVMKSKRKAAVSAALKSEYDILVPQCRPLSPGEILGCTSPRLDRHVNAIMYDPYSKVFSREYYDHEAMRALRLQAIDKARLAQRWGLILGTLGRQGSPKVLEHLESRLQSLGKCFTRVLLSEIFPSKLDLMSDVDAWVQIACPRLSIDWGTAFSKPLLSPYEAAVALQEVGWKDVYPMDFYSNQSLGPWAPNHPDNQPARPTRRQAQVDERREHNSQFQYPKDFLACIVLKLASH
ncbi:hypothetical protein F2P81_016738 [Scophthalmus maximus]|uniref:2-(3-amino-3-carboxypropyl)histidine synthase subunit 1 n=1 Tax=Scophthalmus maximus TaxID=52904 RepID=A0A6A4SA06_SCOMX|nr:hypothetical protein F2P81_016738 [Scophthalmus maximus]